MSPSVAISPVTFYREVHLRVFLISTGRQGVCARTFLQVRVARDQQEARARRAQAPARCRAKRADEMGILRRSGIPLDQCSRCPRLGANDASIKQLPWVRIRCSPPTSLHVLVVASCIARNAPQWGLFFVERPPENVSGLPTYANSPHFLWAMMVEWLFGMHVDKRPPLLQRTVFTLAARRQISTRLRPLVFLRCNVIGAATGSKLD